VSFEVLQNKVNYLDDAHTPSRRTLMRHQAPS